MKTPKKGKHLFPGIHLHRGKRLSDSIKLIPRRASYFGCLLPEKYMAHRLVLQATAGQKTYCMRVSVSLSPVSLCSLG